MSRSALFSKALIGAAETLQSSALWCSTCHSSTAGFVQHGPWWQGATSLSQPVVLTVQGSPHVDVGSASAHGCAGDQAALHQLVGVVAHDLPVLAGAGL